MANKRIAYYAVTYGMAGCYLPNTCDSSSFATRGEMANAIKADLSLYDMPVSLFRDVHIRKLWGFIQRHGSSTAHFALHHKGMVLQFHGLTEDEYNARQAE
jgi:hypothetical protein